MTHILMVCLGNICRSPLAEGILKSKLPSSKFKVSSAGTANYHVGEQPDERSIAIAKAHGIDISNQRGQQFKVEDFDTYQHIFVMDQSNYKNVVKLTRNPEDISKVKLILEAADTMERNEVPDPYYGGIDGFSDVYNLLDDACNKLAEKLLE